MLNNPDIVEYKEQTILDLPNEIVNPNLKKSIYKKMNIYIYRKKLSQYNQFILVLFLYVLQKCRCVFKCFLVNKVGVTG